MELILALFIFGLLYGFTQSYYSTIQNSFDLNKLIGNDLGADKKLVSHMVLKNENERKERRILSKIKLNEGKGRLSYNKTAILKKKKKESEERIGYWIDSMNTTVTISEESCNGKFSSLIRYKFQRGRYSSMMIKLSLEGTIDDTFGIEVTSLSK